ncbi:hypothetical protein [Streptomyces sp. NPDC101249]|uniref:hypothetical protein n=1 Tax=Streptomyces sp. NPDC101249 TaxID=3366140 RepID=UPI00380CFF0E
MNITDRPYEISISGSGFRVAARHPTAEAVYAEAHRIREQVQSGSYVAFENETGGYGGYGVLEIRILCWNPLVGRWLSHARRWTVDGARPDALTPLPAGWHRDPLPGWWFGAESVAGPEQLALDLAPAP